jgi:hypothetical protein
MEFFSAAGTNDPTNYTELDLGPLGTLWAGAIHNPSGKAPVNTTSMFCIEHLEEYVLGAVG